MADNARTQLDIEVNLETRRLNQQLAEVDTSVQGRGLGRRLAGAVGSAFRGAAGGLGQFQESGVGALASFVGGYGLTSFAHLGIPGVSGAADTLRGVGQEFNAITDASQKFLAVNRMFNQAGVELPKSVQQNLAKSALQRGEFVEGSQQRSRDIFLDAAGANVAGNDKVVDTLTKMFETLQDIRDAFRSFFGVSDAGHGQTSPHTTHR